jgi:probable rRNA maturation factor
MAIELSNESSKPCYESDLISVAAYAMAAMGVHSDSDLSITIVDEERMSELHVEWMDLPGPTDVLSFPMDEIRPNSAADGPGIIGDVVLCPDFAAGQSLAHPLADELALLTVHGVLHCLGFDHAQPEEEREMFALQDRILGEWRRGKQ